MYTEDQVVFEQMLALGIVFTIIMIIWGIAAYLLSAFALHTMAKNQGLEDAYFAFIPILNCKTWGDLVGPKMPDYLRPETGWKVLGIFVACFILNFIPIVNFISSIVSLILAIWIMYLLLERYTTNSVLFTIIHLITASLFFPLHLFLIRKNKPRF